MDLTRLQTTTGPRWALDNVLLPETFTLSQLLALPARDHAQYLEELAQSSEGGSGGAPAGGDLLAPIDAYQEVWASGVTFLRSREAREAESAVSDVYQRVYEAQRPELFFKSLGWRVVHPGGPVRIRRDSRWNVPEPELTLVINCHGEICGFCAGNDVSSRDIEGENPLYLPQAKIYNGSCALGPCIRLISDPGALADLPILLDILRDGTPVFQGQTSTKLMKRSFTELAECLFRELSFPTGAFLMTGTGIVPPESFTLQPGDEVHITTGDLVLQNIIAQ